MILPEISIYESTPKTPKPILQVLNSLKINRCFYGNLKKKTFRRGLVIKIDPIALRKAPAKK